ncbi:LacI family DNA-binding transcriptional regulator [Oceanobacillus sp. FSL H7-0719]|uniref:LacI family DNA-binding transcriptional regulator n=1 Tax=Oceanobacillus sp. FSL H7-0719 TaxID=2954507 RepID=UPI003253918C
MSVTIKDVAKRANVSPSTVSRVISNSDKISEATKKKVRKVMNELGYHINLNARMLVQKTTQTIGVVMKHATSEALHNPFFPELLSGISAECHNQDYSLLLTTGNTEESIFNEVVKMAQGKLVDGIIVSYSKKTDKVVPYLQEIGIPFVVIGKPAEHAQKIMHVDNDNLLAGIEATEYLIERGHEQIAFVGDDPEYQVVKDRLNGFENTLYKHQITIPEHYIQLGSWSAGLNQVVVEDLFKTRPYPTAIITTTDTIGLYLLSALAARNIKVPEDMSVITFNNTLISQIATPKMTSVDIQTFQLGFEAAKSVIELIKNPNTFKKSIIIPSMIISRTSTQQNKETIKE